VHSHYDVIVIGAGSMGMSAGYYLARRGVRTLMIDAFDPPHDQGSHHGDTRIIRFAYSDGEIYVPLILRAYELWKQLQEESGNRVFMQTGTLAIGAVDSSLVQNAKKSAALFRLPLDIFEPDEVERRWPGIRMPDGYVGCWEHTAGVLFTNNSIRAYKTLAQAYPNASLRVEKVEKAELHRDGVSVYTEAGVYRASRLVVTAGAWLGKLLPSANLPLTPVRKTFAWFDAPETLYGSDRFPAFIISDENRFYYGFPSIDGQGLKIGRHDGGQPVDPDKLNRKFGIYPEDEGDVREPLRKFMPEADRELKQGKVCLYTNTPDEHFIIDRHPEYPHVVIAGGCSGHGYKFCSVIGEILSQLVVDGSTPLDISPFSIGRFAGK